MKVRADRVVHNVAKHQQRLGMLDAKPEDVFQRVVRDVANVIVHPDVDGIGIDTVLSELPNPRPDVHVEVERAAHEFEKVGMPAAGRLHPGDIVLVGRVQPELVLGDMVSLPQQVPDEYFQISPTPRGCHGDQLHRLPLEVLAAR